MTRDELKKKLIEMGNSYVVTWGASAISKDLKAILQEGEEVLEICGARKDSLLKFFKGGRYVRCYLVITNIRLIYIERGRRDMSLNPLCKKTIIVNRSGMKGNLWSNNKIEKMLYPYMLQIQSSEECCEIAVAKDISKFLQTESKEMVQEKLPSAQEENCRQSGQVLKERSGSENQVNNQMEINRNTTGKKKKKIPIIIGGILGAVLLIFVILVIIGIAAGYEDMDKTERKKISEEVVELNTYDGGFAGWKADGYPGSVRTDITIPYPLGNTEYNNYAVYIGTGKMNVGVIIQENEAPMSEWNWLLEAVPDYDTEAYYFNCILTYTGQDVGEEEIPLFVINDVESYFGTGTEDMSEEEGEEDIGEEDFGIDYESIYGEIADYIYTNGINSSPSYFMEIGLYDIDMDGIMELLINHGTGEADRVYEIYSTDGEQVVKIGEVGGGHSSLYEDAYGNLYLDYCQMGYEMITSISIEDGVILEETLYDGEAGGYVYSDEVLQTLIEMYPVNE